jgi:dienelactone hydrolase
VPRDGDSTARTVTIRGDGVSLEGDLALPSAPIGVVLFAHGSGSSRFSPRNRFVADVLRDANCGTLLLDLLSRAEEAVDAVTGEHRFNIPLLATRLVAAIDWLEQNPSTARLRVGLFGASTGGGAAIVAAAERPNRVVAIVSRGGRPDLAGNALATVQAPTLLIVGGNDDVVIALNERARAAMRAETRLEIVPGATHLFEEPGALERVAELAREWFVSRFTAASGRATGTDSGR